MHVWTALILFLMVATDASSLVSYITRFTEESFAMLIAVIFIYEACMKLLKVRSTCVGGPDESIPPSSLVLHFLAVYPMSVRSWVGSLCPTRRFIRDSPCFCIPVSP